MKWLIASDIHGSSFYCKKLIEAFKHEKADRLLLLGDVLYHGPRNDLPLEYAPKTVIGMLNELADRIICVRGNCDGEVDDMVLDFPVLADYAIVSDASLKQNIIFATHGHKFNTSQLPSLNTGDVLLHGHTHVQTCTPFGKNNYYINPGSVALPKENNPRTYMTYEERKFKLKDIYGNIIWAKSIKRN